MHFTQNRFKKYLNNAEVNKGHQYRVAYSKAGSFFLTFLISLLLVLLGQIEETAGEILLGPIVTIPDGSLVGEIGRTDLDREFYKFWCVPYGKSERFEASVPPDPWEGIRDATNCNKRCTQFTFMEGDNDLFAAFESTEDCHVLNVFTPKMNSSERKSVGPLPVLVFIHGGYFFIGSGLDYSGELFLDFDVLLVTINYRLGPFGFLATGDGVIEGNLGLKDQVLALKWVQKNIKHFGGDPHRVTIVGESAGAGSVSYQVISPMSKGLFAHAIAESGTTLCPWSYQSRPYEIFETYAEALNCSKETTEESKACLKALDVELLKEPCKKTKWLAELVHPIFPSIEWVPPKNPNSQIFLPDHPRKMMEEGNFNRVPFINGVNEDEGAYQGGLTMGDYELLADVNYHWIEKGGVLAGLDTRNITRRNLNLALRKIRRFYFGEEDLVKTQRTLQNMTNLYSDAWFIAGLRLTLRAISKHAPMYTYVFTKKGALRIAEVMGWFDRPVTSHGDELQYLFFKGMAADKADTDFSKRFLKLWVSFARTGKPEDTWGSGKVWSPIDPNQDPMQFYQIDDDTHVIDDPFKARGDFWEDLWTHELREQPTWDPEQHEQ